MIPSSPYWDEKLGVCTKHWLPQVPCPQCLATNDRDVTFAVSATDADVVAYSELFGQPIGFADLVPMGFTNPTLVKAYD